LYRRADHAPRSRLLGKRGFSSYLEAALRRQLEQDNLAELVSEYTGTAGDFTAEELAAARKLVRERGRHVSGA
jgi:hypothetical protein